MDRRSMQRGFAIIEVVLVVVIVGLIAFVAWRVIEANETVDTTVVPQDIVLTDESPAVPEAKDTSDLDALSAQLDATNVEGTTVTELDTQSNF